VSDVWDRHAANRRNVAAINLFRACQCGARDWRPTAPLGLVRYIRQTYLKQIVVAYQCRVCDRVIHPSLRSLKRAFSAKG
jgi:hypothetical protein